MLATVFSKCLQKKNVCAAELYKDPNCPSVSVLTGLGPHRTSDDETSKVLLLMSGGLKGTVN